MRQLSTTGTHHPRFFLSCKTPSAPFQKCHKFLSAIFLRTKGKAAPKIWIQHQQQTSSIFSETPLASFSPKFRPKHRWKPCQPKRSQVWVMPLLRSPSPGAYFMDQIWCCSLFGCFWNKKHEKLTGWKLKNGLYIYIYRDFWLQNVSFRRCRWKLITENFNKNSQESDLTRISSSFSWIFLKMGPVPAFR